MDQRSGSDRDIWGTVYAGRCAAGSTMDQAAIEADNAVDFARLWRMKTQDEKRKASVQPSVEQIKAERDLVDISELMPSFGQTNLHIRISQVEARLAKLESSMGRGD